MSELRCAEISYAAGEPLAGTAVADTDRFLVLEHDAAWGPLGVEDSGLPESVVQRLGALGKQYRRLRVQLVRRRDAQARLKVYFASAGPEPELRAVELASSEALLQLELEPWLRGQASAPGEREDELLYLVCVHGKRDRCCALLGLPVFRALSERVGARALETTHLGGHRFAATLLLLPHGICYGRVEASEAEALVEASARGEFYDLGRVRGRCAYPSEAQAAEVALRAQTGALDLAAYELRGVMRDGDTYAVEFAHHGQPHIVRIRREAMPAMPTSCGADPKPVRRLVLNASPRA